MASRRPRTAMLASLARQHPVAAVFAATTTFVCLPVWLPLLLISFPFLIVTSLLSVAALSLLRRLSASQPSLLRWDSRRTWGMPGRLTFEDVYRIDEGSRESRIHEYLEDQLKSLDVVSLPRNESAEDLLPCSFSFAADAVTWKL